MIVLVYSLPMLIVGWHSYRSVKKIYVNKTYMDWYYDFHRQATQGILTWRIFLGVILTFTPILNFIAAMFIIFDRVTDWLIYFFGDWWRKPL